MREYLRLPGFPSDVYRIMTQRSDYARPRPYAELDQALHILGGYVLLIIEMTVDWSAIKRTVNVTAHACMCVIAHLRVWV